MTKLRQRGAFNGRLMRTGMIAGATLLLASLPYLPAQAADDDYTTLTPVAPTNPPPADSETAGSLVDNLPANSPAYFRKTYLSMMKAPLPAKIYNQGGIPAFVPQLEIDNDPFGKIGSYQPNGATKTSTNAFFQSLGTNGRSCVTCHQPNSGMSVSVRNIKKRMNNTGGRDPIFAPVDGANCPNLVSPAETSGSLFGGKKGKGKKAFKEAHSLLLNKGLIRIPLRVPAGAEYTISVVSDPTTCNLDPDYNSVTDTDGTAKIVSVFRRPLISGNLHFKTTTVFPGPGGNSGNIMWDGREPTLFSQAISATLGHAQALNPPTLEQQQQMVDFETRIFNAQYSDKNAGRLDANGVTAGPVNLSTHGGDAAAFGPPPFDEFTAWASTTGTTATAEQRKSIARGQALFNGTAPGGRGVFTIGNVAGFNDFGAPITNPQPGGTCSTCHNFAHSGADVLPSSQRDIGTGGHAAFIGGPAPASDLPVFKLVCPAGSFLWDANLTSVITNDPGKALITGKCRDIGQKTVPGLRALAAHEPYFSDGSAATLLQVVNFYNNRFSIGLTAQEKQDLVNFMNAL